MNEESSFLTTASLPTPVKEVMTEPTRDDERYQIFPARIVRVDYERKVVAILDKRNNETYEDVSFIPVNSSSIEGTDVDMPEEGTTCLAVSIEWNMGYS